MGEEGVMGYFSNGTAGMIFEAENCAKCAHGIDPVSSEMLPCPVWGLHLKHNYQECNNPDSMLHELIPKGEEKCNMFWPVDTTEQLFKPPLKGEVVTMP
jgi:hypothetical protein